MQKSQIRYARINGSVRVFFFLVPEMSASINWHIMVYKHIQDLTCAGVPQGYGLFIIYTTSPTHCATLMPTIYSSMYNLNLKIPSTSPKPLMHDENLRIKVIQSKPWNWMRTRQIQTRQQLYRVRLYFKTQVYYHHYCYYYHYHYYQKLNRCIMQF